MSVETNYPFTNPLNYTYNIDEIGISGGEQKLKDRRPPDATFYISYASNINANWGDGVLTGIPVGGASVSDGKLDLSYADNRYVDYSAIDNADVQQVGCVRFKYTPNYIGFPSFVTSLHLFTIAKDNEDLKNLITVSHLNTGQLNIEIRDSAGTIIIQQDLGAWSPVIGIPYEFELNFDITAGATRLFVEGVQFGATQTFTGTRDSNIGLFRVGSNYVPSRISNFKVEDVLIFSSVQHTTDYTPDWSNIYLTIYNIDNPLTIYKPIIRTDELISLVETSTKTGND